MVSNFSSWGKGESNKNVAEALLLIEKNII